MGELLQGPWRHVDSCTCDACIDAQLRTVSQSKWLRDLVIEAVKHGSTDAVYLTFGPPGAPVPPRQPADDSAEQWRRLYTAQAKEQRRLDIGIAVFVSLTIIVASLASFLGAR